MTGPGGVTVTIFGRDYTLRSESDEASLVELARVVDGRMREAAAGGGDASPLRVAVLAALNLADDLQRERTRWRGIDDRVDRIAGLLAEEVGKAQADGV